MNASLHRQLNRRKRHILRRIENKPGVERPEPMMAASNIHYELADKTRAIAKTRAIVVLPVPGGPSMRTATSPGVRAISSNWPRRRTTSGSSPLYSSDINCAADNVVPTLNSLLI